MADGNRCDSSYSGLACRSRFNLASSNGNELVYVPLSGYNQGLTLGIATLASIRKTMEVDIFNEFCSEQINTENIPGMAQFE